VKSSSPENAEEFILLVEELKKYHFDAAVIFTVYSQSPLPSALLAYLAGIPNRLAYCRENPYALLTHWVPDKEPYERIVHQVTRDMNLVMNVGAFTKDDSLKLIVPNNAYAAMIRKLNQLGISPMRQPWIIVHPC